MSKPLKPDKLQKVEQRLLLVIERDLDGDGFTTAEVMRARVCGFLDINFDYFDHARRNLVERRKIAVEPNSNKGMRYRLLSKKREKVNETE